MAPVERRSNQYDNGANSSGEKRYPRFSAFYQHEKYQSSLYAPSDQRNFADLSRVSNTKRVIYETIRRSTSTVEKNFGYKEYTDLDDRFYALLGRVLGKSMIQSLV